MRMLWDVPEVYPFWRVRNKISFFWGERVEFTIDVGKENCLCRSDNLSLDSV